MAVEQRLVAPQQTPADLEGSARDWSLRPKRMGEYVGQRQLVERLTIAISAAVEREDPVEHVLLHGPPGLGKTTLAHVIAAEVGSRVHVTSGPALSRPTDLVSVLTRLEERDVLFIDEIHRVPIAVEEFVYPAMEDYRIDVSVDTGLNARSVRIALKPFTLIGATTRAGLVSSPLRSRFGLTHHLRYYEQAEILDILRRSCSLLGVEHDGTPALEAIASRSRGTPRIANRLLRRVRDFAQVRADGRISSPIVDEALRLEGIDELGLDDLDRAYLGAIAKTYRGGPVGLEAIAATMNEDSGTLEDVVEPYLLQIGFLARTRRGRMLTPESAQRMGVRAPDPVEPDSGLFESSSDA